MSDDEHNHLVMEVHNTIVESAYQRGYRAGQRTMIYAVLAGVALSWILRLVF